MRRDTHLSRRSSSPDVRVYCLPDHEAGTIVDGLLEGMFNRFGTPEVNHTDQQLRIPCPQLAIVTAIQQ